MGGEHGERAGESSGEAARGPDDARWLTAVFEALFVHHRGTILEANLPCARLFGYAPRALVGRSALDLLAPEERERLRQPLLAPTEEPVEIVGLRQDGSRFPAELRGRAITWDRRRARLCAVRDITERARRRDRRLALLRIARRFADGADDTEVLSTLAKETGALFPEAGVTVHCWDPQRGLLLPTVVSRFETGGLRLGEGLSGRAARARTTCVVEDYQREIGSTTPLGRIGVRAGVGVPVLHEGRLVGTLAVGTLRPDVRFTAEDIETLELLAGMAAAMLVGLERARLAGALLAARTAQHELNNQLAVCMGYLELLAADPGLPPELGVLVREALVGAEQAATTVETLRKITRLEEVDPGIGTGSVLDLSRSVEDAPPPDTAP